MKYFSSPIAQARLGLRQLYQFFHDSLSNKEFDFTRGSLKKSIAFLAIPMVVEMGMESLFAIVDIFFVAKLGSGAIAVVGLTEAVVILIYAIAIGLSMAATAVIARRTGEKHYHLAEITTGQVIILGTILSCFISFIGVYYARDILLFMGADTSIIKQGEFYTKVMLGGNQTIIYLFILAAVYRGAGNPAYAMRALILANGINIFLDPCLIFGWGPFPELGLKGAAIATNIGRAVGAIYLFAHLFYGSNKIRLSATCFKPSVKIIFNLIKLSNGGILQFLLSTASYLFLVRIVAQFGSEMVAGFTVAIRIVIFTFLPAWGLSNSAATLVGQNLGAQRFDRAEQAVWLTAQLNIAFMVMMGIVLLAFPSQLMGLFTENPQAHQTGITCLRIIALGYPFFALGMVLTQSLNGAGDTFTPSWINFVGFWLLQLPLAWTTANLWQWYEYGVALSMLCADCTIALLAWYWFRKGNWRATRV